MKHSQGHIIEVTWSVATEWIRAVKMFEYRLLHELPEYRFFKTKFSRAAVDFHCFLIACRRLEAAVTMAERKWIEPTGKEKLAGALAHFRTSTPFLAALRNVGEHFDDYLLGGGKNKSIDSRGLRVYSIEYENAKTYRMNWLEYEVDINGAATAAAELYREFIAVYNKAYPSSKSGQS